MPIQANVTNNQITANVGETKIDVTVSGGVGPTGAQGPAGAAGTLPSGTEGYVLTYVSGSWVAAEPTGGVTSWNDLEDKPEFAVVAGTGSYTDLTNVPSAFTPSAHAASHGDGGSDAITINYSQVENLAAFVADNIPTASGSVLGAVKIGSGITITDGVISVSTNYAAASHTHDDRYYTESEIDTLLVGKVGTGDSRLSDARTPTAHNQAWSTITSTPTTLSGYGITDGVITSDSRLSDARTPTAHNQAWSTITSTPTTLSGYGITDAVASSDSRLTDSRTPTAHKSSHATGGSDALSPSDIGAANASHAHAASAITSGSLDIARIPTGTSSSTVCIGNDSRLSDARTPTDGSVTDAKITSGGLSASSINWVGISAWAPSTSYAKGDLVEFQGIAYRRSAAGTSGSSFNTANWQQTSPTSFVVGQLPTVLEKPVTGGNTGTSVTLSLASGSVQTWTLNGNCTFTMPTATAGASLTVILTQNGTNTAAFTGVLWSGGTAPTITTTANKRDILVFVSDGTNWYGTASQNH